MKYFLRDILFYSIFGLIIGVVGFLLDVEARDAWILGLVGMVAMAINNEITERFPRH